MPRTGWLAIGAIAVALLAADAPPTALLVVAGMAAFALAAAGAIGRRNPAVAAAGLGACMIVLRVLLGGVIAPTNLDMAASEPRPNSEHQAVVLSLSAPSAGQQRAVLELRPPEQPDRIYATLPRYPPLAQGDVVSFSGELEAAPLEGGFGDYLARSGIGLTARPRSMERLGADGSPLAALESVRRTSADMIATALPEPQAGLGAAMMIGLRDLVSRDVAADFRTSGLSHVVAISGWHICLLGAVVSGLLAGLSRRRRSILVLAAICGYAILAGASPSILRAAVMASVVLLARESGRRGQASAALAITAAAMLLVDPATISDLGFQLSVAATAGLLAWASRLRTWLTPRLPRRTPAWLLEALAVSLAAQAATLPLVLFHFGTLPLVSPLANLLVTPLVAPAMLFTTVAFACGALIGLGVPALLLAPLSLVGSLSIGAMIAVAHVTAALPFANVALPPPVNVIAAATSAGVVFWLARRRRPSSPAPPSPAVLRQTAGHAAASSGRSRRLAVAGAAAALSLLLAVVYAARPDGRLHMTILDVGQCDAILLEGPSGGRILVDTGPDPDRLLALLDQRVPAWDRRLDLVIITHPHEDHISGVAMLLGRYRIGAIAEPGMVGPGPGDAAYRRRLAELGRESTILAAGDSLWLDGVRLEVLWPLPGRVPLRPADTGTGINNVSIVLDVHFGSRRMLLTGDVEEEIDPRLLAAGIAAADGGDLDVLKVAHHGSGTATTDAFVESMTPEIAVVSAGWGNPYGHPSPATVARLVESGATLFRTDLDGSIEITTDGTDLTSQAGGGRPRTPRPTPSPPPGIGFCPLPQSRGGRRSSTYNRADVDPFEDRRGANPAAIRPCGSVHRALVGRGRDCLFPGARHRAPRQHHRRGAGRGRGTATRRRQAAASRSSAEGSGPRRGRRGMAA